MPALQPVDWPEWKRAAGDFLRRHPQVQVRELTWSERLVVPGAKEAFAVTTHNEQSRVREVGGQPCGRCGNWTAAWCEGCLHPNPNPVCATCDHEHLLCEQCSRSGRLWTECHEDHEPETVEISGFYDDVGTWVSLEPVLRIPMSEIPSAASDGTFDMEFLTRRIAEHQRQCRAQTPGDFGGTA